MKDKNNLRIYENLEHQIMSWVSGETVKERIEKYGKSAFKFQEVGINRTAELEVLEGIFRKSGYMINEAYAGLGEFPKVVLLGYSDLYKVVLMKKNYASALVDIIERLMLETSAANVPLLTENDVVLVGVGGIAGEYNGCEQGLVRTKNPDKSWKISDPLLYHFSGNVVPGGFRIIFNDDPVLSERITQAAVDLKKNETALYLDAVRELSKGKQVKRIVWEGDLDFSNPEDVEDYIKRQQEKKPVAEHALEDYINGHLERLEKTIIPKLQENLGFRKVYQVLELEDIAAGSVQKALQESKIPYLVAVPRRWPANQNED